MLFGVQSLAAMGPAGAAQRFANGPGFWVLTNVFIEAAQSAARCALPSNARRAWRRLANDGRRQSAPIAAARELLSDVYYTWRRLGD